MLEISLDDSDLQRGLGQLLRNARHPRPMMRAIAAELLSITEDNFESESWGGKKWPANARGGKILQKSGQLAAGIHTASGSNFARIGTNKPYAAIHQFGASRPKPGAGAVLAGSLTKAVNGAFSLRTSYLRASST